MRSATGTVPGMGASVTGATSAAATSGIEAATPATPAAPGAARGRDPFGLSAPATTPVRGYHVEPQIPPARTTLQDKATHFRITTRLY